MTASDQLAGDAERRRQVTVRWVGQEQDVPALIRFGSHSVSPDLVRWIVAVRIVLRLVLGKPRKARSKITSW